MPPARLSNATESDDPFAAFKHQQKEGWQHYIPLEVHTAQPAAHLVRIAGVVPGARVLDVACGTGPVAITARRHGATVTGLDLTPALLERARENAAIAEVDDIDWHEGDVEAMPFDDTSFDVVLSQFGHIFAPRPERAIGEMLRVLKPGGTIAFSTWPPEAASGVLFGAVGRHLPAPPGVPAPTEWGDIATVRERLGDRVRDLYFERGVLHDVGLSPQHNRSVLEKTLAPLMAVMHQYRDQPARQDQVRRELDAALAPYHRDNATHFEYVVTRGRKV